VTPRAGLGAILSLALVTAVLSGGPSVVPASAAVAHASSSTPARFTTTTSSLPGVLRFDQPRYDVPGCVSATLIAPDVSAASPTLSFHDLGTKDVETGGLTSAGPGRWTAARCMPLGTGKPHQGDGVLAAQTGDVVFVTADDGTKALAIGSFFTTGTKPGSTATIATDPVPLPATEAVGAYGPNVSLRKGRTRAVMALDDVLVSDSVPGDLAGFLARYHGTDLGSLSIPSAPAGGTLSTFHNVMIDPTQFDATGFASVLARLHSGGGLLVSSPAATQLLALITTEQTAGLSVWPNLLMEAQDAPVSNEGDAVSAFTNEWYNPAANDGSQAVRAGDATALLHLMRVPSRFTPAPVAVIDSGFAGPNDFGGGFTAPDYGAPSGDFNQIPQCHVDGGSTACGPGAAAGPNAVLCQGGFACPWHGYTMAMTAAGQFHNGWGDAAGIGGQTAQLKLFRVDNGYEDTMANAIAAASATAKIESISSGASCKVGLDLCSGAVHAALALACTLSLHLDPLSCGLLEASDQFGAVMTAVTFANASGVTIFAAAGNGKDVDPSAIEEIPCILNGVLCVGALAPGKAPVAAPIRNPSLSKGARINFWAPGSLVMVAPQPGVSTPCTYKTCAIAGTSPATAFMSGTASIALAIDPSLNALQLRTLLKTSGCKTGNITRTAGPACTPSADPNVDGSSSENTGYVDVLEVVREASQAAGLPGLGTCTGGFDELAVPTGDTPATAQSLGTITAALSGTLASQSDVDRSLTDLDRVAGGGQDTTYYDVKIGGSIPGVKAINVRAQISVADPSLGTLQLQFWKIDRAQIGPPTLTVVPSSLAQDTSSGTGFVQAPLEIGSEYLVQVLPVGPIEAAMNCYDNLKLTAMEQGPNPPPHDPWLEVGHTRIYPGISPPPPGQVATIGYLPVTLTSPLPYDVTVHYSFLDGTAIAGTNYLNTPGTVSISAGHVAAAIPVSVFGSAGSGFLDFGATITANAPVQVATGWVEIQPGLTKAAKPKVQVSDTAVWEGDNGIGVAHITVNLDRPAKTPVAVNYTTADDSALAGTDYVAATGTLIIPTGGTSADLTIALVPNTFPEFTRKFFLQLTSITGTNAVLGPHSSGFVNIVDDDPTP